MYTIDDIKPLPASGDPRVVLDDNFDVVKELLALRAVVFAESSTSLSISLGTKNFQVPTGTFWLNGKPRVRINYKPDSSYWMEGIVTSSLSNTGAVTVDVDKVNKSGTFNDWVVAVAGEPAVITPGVAIADADGSLTDATRAINAILAFLRAKGLIST